MRPFKRSEDTDDIQDIQRVANDAQPDWGRYCKAKFKYSFSHTPIYKFLLKDKLILDLEGAKNIILSGQDLNFFDKSLGNIASIGGFVADPLIFTILAVLIWQIIKNKRTQVLFKTLKEACFLLTNKVKKLIPIILCFLICLLLGAIILYCFTGRPEATYRGIILGFLYGLYAFAKKKTPFDKL